MSALGIVHRINRDYNLSSRSPAIFRVKPSRLSSDMDIWGLPFSILVASSYGIAFANSEGANVSDYPYHVSVEYKNEHRCSGAFITERWVLTVASCVRSNGLADLTARFSTAISSTGGEQVGVRSVIIHDDFDPISYNNDIALLELNLPLVYGDGKLPIILPTSGYEIADETLTYVTGWVADAVVNSGLQLTVVSTPIVNPTACKSSLPVFKELTDSMLCAGYMSANAEVCQGDTGAPLVHQEQLVGLLSYGLGCTKPTYPSVYTKIASFVPWIHKYTGVLY